MSGATLLRDVEFQGSEAGWESFDLLHDLAHRRVHTLMLQRGLTPQYVPMGGFPKDGKGSYLQDHNQVHLATATLLGITPPPDISQADFTDQQQFENWFTAHYLIHASENAFLGIQ